MLDTDCTTALAQSNIVFGASPFGISATELNPGGYTTPICYKCNITPTGLTPIEFTKEISITANPLDCSGSLVDAIFANPTILYNSAGSSVSIAADYNSIFTHTM